MIEMENIGFQEQDLGDFIPESLFEAIDQLNNEGKSCTNTSVSNVSIDEFMDFDLDLNSENCTMNSFLELEKEIDEHFTQIFLNKETQAFCCTLCGHEEPNYRQK